MAEVPRINLIGAGAVGSLLAASLSYNELPFHWVVRNPARRAELMQFLIHTNGEQIRFQFPQERIITTVGRLPSSDWTIIATKAHQVDSVLSTLPADAANKLLVVGNGLHEGAYHLGLLYGGSRLIRGNLITTSDSKLLLGALPGAAEASPEMLRCLTTPWLLCGANEVIAKRMWHKLCLNCVINPLSALLDRPNGELMAWTDSPLIPGVIGEVSAVAALALGRLWSYGNDSIYRDLFELLARTSQNSSSMREDLRGGRETEISRMNLAVAELGEHQGQPCPLTRALGIMIAAITNRSRGGSVPMEWQGTGSVR
jgi:2-dehydropantoate 2-reductase